MQIHRKPRKSPLNDFVSMIVPDRIEEAYDRVDDYFTVHLQLNFDSPEGVAGVLTELIRDHGVKVRKALYALLCEENGPFRPLVSGATGNGVKSAVGFLVPVLAAQFSIAPAVALLVATLVLKTAAAQGEKSLCEELIRLNRKTTRHLDSIDPRKRAGQQRNTSPRRNNPQAENKPSHQRRGAAAETTPSVPFRRSGTPSSAGAGTGQKPTPQKSGPAAEAPLSSPRRRPASPPSARTGAVPKPFRQGSEPAADTMPTKSRRRTGAATAGAAGSAKKPARKRRETVGETVVTPPAAEKPRRRTNRKPPPNADSQ